MIDEAEPSDNEIEELLRSRFGRQAKNRVADLTKEYLPVQEERLRRGHEQQELHDSLLDICASAFGPEGPLSEGVDFRLLCAEPLYELGVPNFDLLIFSPRHKIAIFVEGKSSITSPGEVIHESYLAIAAVQENQSYLSDQIGDEIRETEFVICVPSEERSKLTREIRRQEESGEIDGSSAPLLRIWEVNKFKDQTLNLYTPIPSRPNDFDSQHRDPDLTRLLAQGVRVTDSEVNFQAYPSSHPVRHGQRVVARIFADNLAADRPLKEFSEYEVREVFASSTYTLHYDRETIADGLTQKFFEKGVQFGLIQPLAGRDGWYELRAKGRKLPTILANYKDGYFNSRSKALAERRALEVTLREFRSEHPELSTFGEGESSPE